MKSPMVRTPDSRRWIEYISKWVPVQSRKRGRNAPDGQVVWPTFHDQPCRRIVQLLYMQHSMMSVGKAGMSGEVRMGRRV